MYLQENDTITWFNGEEGCFHFAIGPDGAPFGKDGTALLFLWAF